MTESKLKVLLGLGWWELIDLCFFRRVNAMAKICSICSSCSSCVRTFISAGCRLLSKLILRVTTGSACCGRTPYVPFVCLSVCLSSGRTIAPIEKKKYYTLEMARVQISLLKYLLPKSQLPQRKEQWARETEFVSGAKNQFLVGSRDNWKLSELRMVWIRKNQNWKLFKSEKDTISNTDNFFFWQFPFITFPTFGQFSILTFQTISNFLSRCDKKKILPISLQIYLGHRYVGSSWSELITPLKKGTAKKRTVFFCNKNNRGIN